MWEPFAYPDGISRIADAVRSAPSVAAARRCLTCVVHAQPARVLASLSARADLVVLGKHATDGVAVGSIQNAVLSHARGPVAIVPS